MNELPLVYIETTVPSFYHEVRQQPEFVAWRRSTRRWWGGHSERYRAVTSEAVIAELEGGDFPGRDDALAMLEGIERLELTEAVRDTAAVYIDR